MASDCIAGHTAAKGQPFGGGYAIATPFGKIFGSNISSDKDYGIGNWTDRQFVDTVRKGVRPDGQHLFGGGDLGAWFAYNITPDQKNGVGARSDKQLVQYLHSGDVPGTASAAGPT